MNKYFDNASTTYPKPEIVSETVADTLKNIQGNHSRGFSKHSIKIAEVFYETRELLSNLFNAQKPENIIFTSNATTAINNILFGLNLYKKHVLVTPLEHNAVMRPLNFLTKSKIITYSCLPCNPDGSIILQKIKKHIKKNTALIIVNHVSNVNGLIQEIQNIRQYAENVPILVDAAQSAGITKIDVSSSNIDYLVFTGHKALKGPSGTGGFYIKNPESIKSLIYGGTGSKSDSIDMPDFSPDKFEAGTPNIPGIFGLNSALKVINSIGIKTNQIETLLDLIPTDYNIFCSCKRSQQAPLFSITHKSKKITDIANDLYNKFELVTRIGLHCSPNAHKFLGTYPEGTIRISLSTYHNNEDIQYLVSALHQIDKE